MEATELHWKMGMRPCQVRPMGTRLSGVFKSVTSHPMHRKPETPSAFPFKTLPLPRGKTDMSALLLRKTDFRITLQYQKQKRPHRKMVMALRRLSTFSEMFSLLLPKTGKMEMASAVTLRTGIRARLHKTGLSFR